MASSHTRRLRSADTAARQKSAFRQRHSTAPRSAPDRSPAWQHGGMVTQHGRPSDPACRAQAPLQQIRGEACPTNLALKQSTGNSRPHALPPLLTLPQVPQPRLVRLPAGRQRGQARPAEARGRGLRQRRRRQRGKHLRRGSGSHKAPLTKVPKNQSSSNGGQQQEQQEQ